MSRIQSKELLTHLHKESEDFQSLVHQEFDSLNIEQLNWHPSQKKWSILACIEHVNRANRIYMDRIRKQIEESQEKEIPVSTSYQEGFMGHFATEKMRPDTNGEVTNRMRTFNSFDPEHSHKPSQQLSPQVLQEFQNQQTELQELLDLAENTNLGKIRVQSLAPILKFRLGDAFRFVMAHTHRHLIQAIQVKKHDNFPQFNES